MANPQNGELVYDALTAFLGGVNSGLNPILLRKDQLAFATNATVRGGYIGPRPPYRKMTLVFDPSTIQDAFEQGFFQGATTYRPDFGNHLLLDSTSGAIYKCVISGTTITVTDVSIVGDPNPATTGQVWMWQGEKWVIINNGTSLPIIFDGVSCRRSYGASVVLGTATAFVPASPPPIGETVLVTLTAPYTGPFNVPVQFNGAFYQTIANAGTTPTYDVTLTNISVPSYKTNGNGVIETHVGDNVPVGTTISVENQLVAAVSAPGVFNTPTTFPPEAPTTPGNPGLLGSVTLNTVEGIVPGNTVLVILAVGAGTNSDPNCVSLVSNFFRGIYVTSVDSASKTITGIMGSGCGYGLSDGSSVISTNFTSLTVDSPTSHAYYVGVESYTGYVINSKPWLSVPIGKTTAAFVNPAVGASVVIKLDVPYTGANGQLVTIGDAHYLISNVPTVPGMLITMVNLSDEPQTPAVNYTNPSDITSVPEFPAGRMGAYGMGRNWMSLPDGISFMAGNIVGGEAGTQAENYRDSILKTTENDYLDTGTFRLPSAGDVITAMTFTTTLDASLGQGPLQVFTATNAFSVNAPVDRVTWQSLTFPILTQSLIGIGALAQQSMFAVNSDTFFRSLVGWYSLIQARRDISEQWGNTPMTREMERVLNQEDKSQLAYVSGIQFDNRALFSAVPQPTGRGVTSVALVALNLDPISSIGGKSPPIYDGSWTGLNTLQLLRAVVDSKDRAFAFVQNVTDQKIEIWELLSTTDVGDSYSVQSERVIFDNNGTTDTRIEWSFETSVLLKEQPGMPLLKLEGGEMYVEDMVGEVDVTVQYKPDSYPCWVPWKRFSLCAERATTDDPNLKPGFKAKAGFGEPPLKEIVNGAEVTYCDPYSKQQLRLGHRFQLKFLFRGHLRFLGCKIGASIQPELPLAKPECRPQGTTPTA